MNEAYGIDNGKWNDAYIKDYDAYIKDMDHTPNLYSDYSTNATPKDLIVSDYTEQKLPARECPDGYEFVNTCPPTASCIKRMGYCKKKVATTSISSTTTPTTTTKMQWVLPALVVGAGLFLIFRKSE